MNKKTNCTLTFKRGEHKMTMGAFQSPRGITYEGKRPDTVLIDCHHEFDQIQLLRFAKYLQDIAFALGFDNQN